MRRKVLYLAAALLLPIAIFLFLKFFGRNEFVVAPLFQESLPSTVCSNDYDLPYIVPDSVRRLVFSGEELAVVIFPGKEKKEEAGKLIKRLKALFSEDPVTFYKMDQGIAGKEYAMLRECVFFLAEDMSVALIDREGRIMGQYNAASMEEVDRLIVEMKIILRKF